MTGPGAEPFWVKVSDDFAREPSANSAAGM
jgi:hypothetical protein